MNSIEDGTAVAEPSDNEKDSKSNHENSDNLSPKATGKLVLDGGFLARAFSRGGLVFSC